MPAIKQSYQALEITALDSRKAGKKTDGCSDGGIKA
jgi:hypothetical protein